MLWVLEAVYKVQRREILDAIKDLLELSILRFENKEALLAFLRTARKTNLDLSDILILSVARNKGCQKVLTFDRRASRHEGFELLK